MRQKLHDQMKQKVDDEDDRIAKAVAEQEKKRLVSTSVCSRCYKSCVFSLLQNQVKLSILTTVILGIL